MQNRSIFHGIYVSFLNKFSCITKVGKAVDFESKLFVNNNFNLGVGRNDLFVNEEYRATTWQAGRWPSLNSKCFTSRL